jgi:hypothetical protein
MAAQCVATLPGNVMSRSGAPARSLDADRIELKELRHRRASQFLLPISTP